VCPDVCVCVRGSSGSWYQLGARTITVTAATVPCSGSWALTWGTCSQNCDGGTQTRSYAIAVPASGGGAPCPASHGQLQSRPCNTQACTGPAVDCHGSWGNWSACAGAGAGSRTRAYTVQRAAQNNGAACAAADSDVETLSCAGPSTPTSHSLTCASL
jgi:hypothetical protein